MEDTLTRVKQNREEQLITPLSDSTSKRKGIRKNKESKGRTPSGNTFVLSVQGY